MTMTAESWKCRGCGRLFHGARGLRAHQSRPHIALACRPDPIRDGVMPSIRSRASEAIPVLLPSGTGHYGVCDYTLCGLWIGEGTFGDFEVGCATCDRIHAKAGWGCVQCEA